MQAELVAVAEAAANDAAEHVAALLVAGQNAVGDEESGRPGVVGDDAQRRIIQCCRGVGEAGRADDLGNQCLEEVVVVVAAAALDDGGDPLQAHAGIDAWRFQRRQRAVRAAVELRKDEIPELGVTVAFLVRRTWRAAGDLRAQVVEEFRIRAAGAGVAHRPEVVLVGHHAAWRQAHGAGPDAPRLVVVRVHGHPDTVLGELQDIGDELPGPDDGVFLEVVAEAEVAEHLEERLVAPGVADVFQIVVLAAGAYAPLATHGALVVAAFAPGQRVLELHHASVGEEQRRVVGGHQRSRRHHPVAALGEEVEIGGANVASQHRLLGVDGGRSSGL